MGYDRDRDDRVSCEIVNVELLKYESNKTKRFPAGITNHLIIIDCRF